MSDHLVLFVDRLVRPVPVEPLSQQPAPEPLPPVNELPAGPSSSIDVEDDDDGGEDAPLLQMGECRICQEEDSINNLESPCACSGSLKYAHRKCVQHWCNEKGDTTCEICHKSYEPGYIAPPPRPHPEETTIDIGGGWTISGTPLDLRDPRLLAIAEAERQFFEAEYDGYAASNASGAAFWRSAALILMALLLLRHALSVTDADAEDDPSTFFSLFLLRAAGFLLPCYIMAWAISILQRRRQRQALKMLKNGDAVFAMDPRLRRSPASIKAMKKVLKLAFQCLAPSRQSRPAMNNCAEVLWGIRKNFKDETTSLSALPSHHSENFPQREKNKHMVFGIEDDDSYKFTSAPNHIHS